MSVNSIVYSKPGIMHVEVLEVSAGAAHVGEDSEVDRMILKMPSAASKRASLIAGENLLETLVTSTVLLLPSALFVCVWLCV